VIEGAQPITVGEVLATTSATNIGIVADDEVLWGAVSWRPLLNVLERSASVVAVAPVSNETTVEEQRVVPPFVYSTPSLLQRASQEHFQRYCGQWREVPAFEPFAFLVRREALQELDPALSVVDVPAHLARQGGTLAIALDTYVHRYALVYEQPRLDLQEYIPVEARVLLDIGCAAGMFGAALKQRQDCTVVGIETNPAFAQAAATRLDRVLVADVETLIEPEFSQKFDCITCGDVLEHLRDPWAMVTKLSAWLRPDGRLIATVPNVGHWSIVSDLVQGRWDLVPFGLLCWGHLRFFTRSGIEQMVRDSGLTLETVHGIVTEIPATGEQFLQQAKALIPRANLESLRTSEFLFVARKWIT
jgi:2-polyprenyl-3-methyl-5-hydroxy-6-metoxy-1,4-benzoquinol methylase